MYLLINASASGTARGKKQGSPGRGRPPSHARRGLSHIAQGHRMDTLQSLDNAPQAHDSVAAWFDPLLSERLEQAGFGTLRQLVQRINDTGMTWWYPVRGIGVRRAERLVQWLHEQQESTGMQVDLRNLQAHRPSRHAPGRLTGPSRSPSDHRRLHSS